MRFKIVISAEAVDPKAQVLEPSQVVLDFDAALSDEDRRMFAALECSEEQRASLMAAHQNGKADELVQAGLLVAQRAVKQAILQHWRDAK